MSELEASLGSQKIQDKPGLTSESLSYKTKDQGYIPMIACLLAMSKAMDLNPNTEGKTPQSHLKMMGL